MELKWTKPSNEFLELREAIQNSEFYEENPEFACLILPGIDFLNLSKFLITNNEKFLTQILKELKRLLFFIF